MFAMIELKDAPKTLNPELENLQVHLCQRICTFHLKDKREIPIYVTTLIFELEVRNCDV